MHKDVSTVIPTLLHFYELYKMFDCVWRDVDDTKGYISLYTAVLSVLLFISAKMCS